MLGEYERLFGQEQRLDGNIVGYKKSRKQSAGGQCPLLHEPCLNIKRKGLISLESYFDGLLEEEYAQLSSASQQLSSLKGRIDEVKPYADALGKLGQFFEQCDRLAQQVRRLALDISRLDLDKT